MGWLCSGIGRLSGNVRAKLSLGGNNLTKPGTSITRKSVDICALAEELTRHLAERELRRGVEVTFSISGQVRDIEGDAIMLEEAIENLLDNACRYGCPAGGAIDLELAFNENELILTVADSGPGIPQELRDRVFDRFFRVNDDATGGCGLGLAIVRTVAETHGGHVRLAETDRGMAVIICLPLATA